MIFRLKPIISFLLFLSLASAGCTAFSMRVEEPRTSPASAGDEVAVYFVLSNATLTDDTLLGASSPIAASVEIHRSALIAEEDREAIEENGGEYNYFSNQLEEPEEEGIAAQEVQLEMAKLDSVWIAAGHEIEFKPAYYHLMLIGLKLDVHSGDHFPLALHFANYGDLVIDVTVGTENE